MVDLVTIAGFILLLLWLLGVSVMMIIRAPDVGVTDKNVYLRPRPKNGGRRIADSLRWSEICATTWTSVPLAFIFALTAANLLESLATINSAVGSRRTRRRSQVRS